MTLTTPPRRTVLQVGFAAASVAVVAQACSDNEKEQAEEVTPPEDLMREHGVLDRVLLMLPLLRGWVREGASDEKSGGRRRDVDGPTSASQIATTR